MALLHGSMVLGDFLVFGRYYFMVEVELGFLGDVLAAAVS
jgi:hypothetical protein